MTNIYLAATNLVMTNKKRKRLTSPERRDLIVRKPAMSELKSLVYHDPSMRLLAQALAKVEQGKTSIEEVARVVGLV